MSKYHKGATPYNGIVYFLVGSGPHGLICKVGFTGGDVWKRVSQIQACSPLELDIFGYVEGTLDLERKFHETFAPLRLHGEWFAADFKLRDFIYYLSEYGAAKRLTTADELDIAISDVILAKASSYPAMSDEDYMASAIHQIWEAKFA